MGIFQSKTSTKKRINGALVTMVLTSTATLMRSTAMLIRMAT